jgi:polyisoprenoid-binding protein YceI
MMKKLALLFISVLTAGTVIGQTKWNVDPAHSQVMFTATHLVISEVTGNFGSFNANVTADKADFTDAKIEFTVDVNSINTGNEMRDNHLKSDDFFNASKYPEIKFKGKELKKVSGNKYKLTGDLTIREVTKTITADVTYAGIANDPYGNTKAGFKVKGTINRFDYGLKWNTLTEAGGAVVGKDIEFQVNLQLAKQK